MRRHIVFVALVGTLMSCYLRQGALIKALNSLRWIQRMHKITSPQDILPVSKYMESLPTQKKLNIYFMKVPKTGSTTLYNVLSRLAIHKDLRVATYNFSKRPYFSPKDRQSIITYLVPEFRVGVNKKFNLLIDHSNFDLPAITQVIEFPIQYVTMLRRPSAMIRSWLYFQGQGVKSNNGSKVFTDPVLAYLRKPEKEFINPVANQFRFNTSMNQSSLVKMLKSINRSFLVGISEYFTKSIILFKRRLHLKTQDIVFLHLRKQSYHKHISISKEEDHVIEHQSCTLNNLDCQIYEYFNNTFWHQIRNERNAFKAEVKHFEITLRKISRFCEPVMANGNMYDNISNYTNTLHIRSSRWNTHFKITFLDCAVMTINERGLMIYIFHVQNPEACKTLLASSTVEPFDPMFGEVILQMCRCAPDRRKMLEVIIANQEFHRLIPAGNL